MARMTDSVEEIVAEFRTNGGKIGGDFASGTFMVLTTTGAKTGRERLTIVEYLPHNDRVYVFAIGPAAGTPSHPARYHNLGATPDVTIEIGAERIDAMATVVRGPERDAIWEAMVAHHPHFAAYRDNPFREIPVVALQPKTPR